MLTLFDHINEIRNKFDLETIIKLMFLGKAKFSEEGYVISPGYGDKGILAADVNPGMSIIGVRNKLKNICICNGYSFDELNEEYEILNSLYYNDKKEYKRCLKMLLQECYNSDIIFKMRINDIFIHTVIGYMDLTRNLKPPYSLKMSNEFHEKVKTFLDNNLIIYNLYYRSGSIWYYSNKNSTFYHEYKTPEEAISFLEKINKINNNKINNILIDWFRYYKHDESDIIITQC